LLLLKREKIMGTAGVLIAENELATSMALEQLLASHPSVRLKGIARDGRSALDLAKSLDPDIIFLAAAMPKLDWEEMAATASGQRAPIIIVVGNLSPGVRSFDFRPLDCLARPLEESQLTSALTKALRRLELSGRTAIGNLTSFSDANRNGGRLPVKQGGRTVFLDLNGIDYLEAAGNYVCVHAGEERYTVRNTLSGFEEQLQHHDFVRIHRSVIVNRRRVRELKPWPTGEYIVTLVSGKELTLSRGFRSRLADLLRIA